DTYLPNALHGATRLVGRGLGSALLDSLVQCFALLLQTVQPHKATGDREPLGLISQPGCAFLLRQLSKPFAAEACPRMPRHDVWHTEAIGGVLTDSRRALASPSTSGPGGLGIHIHFREHADAEQGGQPARSRVIISILQTPG